MMLWALLLCGLGVESARAEQPEPQIPILALSEQADRIIVGTVLASRNQLDRDAVWTVATVRVAETLLGEPALVLDVWVPGGRMENLEMAVMGAPRLIPNDQVLLFLRGKHVVGFGRGAFVIAQDRVWRAHGDWAFMHPKRLDASASPETYYASLALSTVREQVMR
jgi:hypothetical protein